MHIAWYKLFHPIRSHDPLVICPTRFPSLFSQSGNATDDGTKRKAAEGSLRRIHIPTVVLRGSDERTIIHTNLSMAWFRQPVIWNWNHLRICLFTVSSIIVGIVRAFLLSLHRNRRTAWFCLFYSMHCTCKLMHMLVMTIISLLFDWIPLYNKWRSNRSSVTGERKHAVSLC